MPQDNGKTRINGKQFTVLENLNVIGEFRTSGTLLGESLIDSSSTASTQSPTSLDTPIQVEFGEAISTGMIDLASDGTLTIKVTAYYQFVVNLTFGRDATNGIAYLFGRYLVNDVQPPTSNSVAAVLPNNTIRIPKLIVIIGKLQEGDEITFEIARDSAGVNNGGLFQEQLTTLDWLPAPTASIQVYNVE
jgi:hypothetical protein